MEQLTLLGASTPFDLHEAIALAGARAAAAFDADRGEMARLFGGSERLSALLDAWRIDGIDFGRVVVVPVAVLRGGRAAYAASTDTIYIADDLFDRGLSPEAIVDVLVEELGHRIDARVNVVDTPGDEGSAFAAIVRGETATFVPRDDHVTIILPDLTQVAVEQTVTISDSGGFEGSFQTITLENTNGGTINYSFQFFGIPDRFIIRYEGRTLIDTGFVSGGRSGQIELPAGASDQLVVIVATDDAGTAWNYTVSVEPEDCPDVDPWTITALGSPFEHNAMTDVCETTGSIAIGRTDGAARLITAANSTKAEYTENQAKVTGATIFSGMGGISQSLFTADFTLNWGTGIAALENIKPGDFKLAGLGVEFKSMALLSDVLAFDVRFTLPGSASGLVIDTVDFFDDALRISADGASPVLGFKIDPPGTKKFKLLDFIEVEASKMSIEYRGAEDALRFQAKIAIANTNFAKTKSGINKLEADLSGDNYVQVNSDGDVDLIGVLKVEGEIGLVGGWSLKALEFNINTTTREIGGSASLGTPFGLKFGEGAEVKATVEFIYDPFELDKVGLVIDNLNKPIPAYPAFFFQSIGGSVDNFAPSNTKDVEGTFTIGATLGPQIGGTRLARAQFDAKVTSKAFEGAITTDILTADFKLLGDSLGVFTLIKDVSTATLDWSKGEFKFVGTSNVLDGFFVTTGTFTANTEFDFGFARSGQMSIPNFVPVFGGTKIANSNLAVSFTSDGDFSNDYAAAWGQYTISTPFDTYTLTLGLRIAFDGEVTRIGAGNIPKVGSWFIEDGTEFFVVSADWENADPDAKVFVTMPDGTIIQEADFAANNIFVIEELSGPTSRVIVIGSPVEGIWDMELVDEIGKGAINYEASGQVDLSELAFTGAPVDAGGGAYRFDFTADVTGPALGNVTFFYDDDLTVLDGIVAGSARVGDGAGSFTWNAGSVVPGSYFLYAQLDDGSGPIIFAQTTTAVAAGSQADVSVGITASVGELLAGDVVRYTVTAINLSATTTATGVTALVDLPADGTLVTSSIVGAASDFADLAFSLGNLAAGASASFTYDVRVAIGTPVGTAFGSDVYVVTDNYDPETLNDSAGIETRIQAPAAGGVADLTVDSTLAETAQPVVGETFTYSVTISNNGTADATNVVLRELTTNLTGIAADRAITVIAGGVQAAIGTIAAGASVTVVFTAEASFAGAIRATSAVTSDAFDGSIVDNEELNALVALGPPPIPADLSVSLTAAAPDIRGEVVITVQVDNAGLGVASGVGVKIDLPDGVELISQSAIQGSYDADTEIWSVGNMRDGLTRTIALRVKGDIAVETVTAEIVTVFEGDPDSTPGDGVGDDFATLPVDFGGAPARPNVVPLAADDRAATTRGTAIDIDVIANDRDADGDRLVVELVGDPANGTAAINADGTVRYTPDAGFQGSDRFLYVVDDGFGGEALAYVDVDVRAPAVNTAPIAVDDSGFTSAERAVTIDVRANDGDVDGDAIAIVTVTDPAKGTAAIVDGRILYTPDTGFVGEERFAYTIADGRGGTASAQVTVRVDRVNQPPRAADDDARTATGTPVTLTVLANDADPDGGALVLRSLTDPANGSAAINPDGTVLYTPDAGFIGVDRFTYVVADADGALATAAVSVRVDQANRAPVASADIGMTTENRTVRIDVLANDRDPDGDAMTVTGVGGAANGATAIGPDGAVRYTPTLGFVGTDRFTYTVRDGTGATATATVAVEVTPRAATGGDRGQAIIALGDGGALGVFGSATIFGTAGHQQVEVIDLPGTIELDASFNLGGDRLILDGDAAGYTLRRSGSSVEIGDGDTLIIVPVGTVGVAIAFADGDRVLRFDAAGNRMLIGDQLVTGEAAPIIAAAAPVIGGTLDPEARAIVAIVEDGVVGLSGVASVFGNAGNETVRVAAGSDVIFDASFNTGGDIILIGDDLAGFTASRSGSSAIVGNGETVLRIPLGGAGITIGFTDGERELRIDLVTGEVVFAAPVATPAMVAPQMLAPIADFAVMML